MSPQLMVAIPLLLPLLVQLKASKALNMCLTFLFCCQRCTSRRCFWPSSPNQHQSRRQAKVIHPSMATTSDDDSWETGGDLTPELSKLQLVGSSCRLDNTLGMMEGRA